MRILETLLEMKNNWNIRCVKQTISLDHYLSMIFLHIYTLIPQLL